MRFHIKYRTKIVKITFSFGEWRETTYTKKFGSCIHITHTHTPTHISEWQRLCCYDIQKYLVATLTRFYTPSDRVRDRDRQTGRHTHIYIYISIYTIMHNTERER